MNFSDALTFFRDGTWQFIGALLALVAVFFAAKQTKKKRLQYEVQTSSELLTQSEELAGKVQVLFENREVSNIDVWVVRVANTGNMEILQSDFVTPVRFSFAASAVVLSAAIVRSTPENLGARVDVESNVVTLQPLLMNSGEHMAIKMLVANSAQKIVSVSARVVGMTAVTELPRGQIIPASVKVAFFAALAGMVALFASFNYRTMFARDIVGPFSLIALLYAGFELLRWMVGDVFNLLKPKILKNDR